MNLIKKEKIYIYGNGMRPPISFIRRWDRPYWLHAVDRENQLRRARPSVDVCKNTRIEPKSKTRVAERCSR